ncbi:Sensor histidine kinase RcsC [anaerobic digester metagenome]
MDGLLRSKACPDGDRTCDAPLQHGPHRSFVAHRGAAGPGARARVRPTRVLTAVLAAFLLCAFLAVNAWGGGRHALLISSYHPGFPTFFDQVGGLREALEPAGVALDVEFMDTKRFPVSEASARFLDTLRFKLGALPAYDVVVTADDAALRFVLDHGRELFPGLDVVFFGVNDQDLAHGLSGSQGFTGIIESVSMDETLQDIRTLRPGVRAVHAVVDGQPGGRGDLRTYLSQRGRIRDLELHVLDLGSMSWDELGVRLAAVPKSDAILLLSAYMDRQGEGRSFEDSLGFILRHAGAPVFHLWAHGIGQGIVGGKVISHLEQGRLAGGLVLRILGGEAARDIPVIEGDDANRHVFDHAALTRFGIDEGLLPDGSDVRGRPVSVLSHYMHHILLAAALVCVLVALVAALLHHVFRLRSAKASLMDSEARYKALFNANADGILVAEKTGGRFVFVNPAMCSMFGYSESEFLSLGVGDIHPRENLAEVFANFEQQARGQKDVAVSLPCLCRDGRVFTADIRSFLLEVDGKPCLVGLFRDVTERSQVLEALRQARDAADAANRSKSEFLANMSHEIRTPLNGILGMLQLLEGLEQSAEQRQYVQMAANSARRLTGLLSDILDLSRIESGRLAVCERPFELREICASIEELFSQAAARKGVRLEVTAADGLPGRLTGDALRLRQILFNLVGNAVKFTSEGFVRVDMESLGQDASGRERILFCVGDSGPGMEDAFLSRAFEPFVQAEKEYVRQHQGAGLGLAIVKRLVHMLGGTLAIDNAPDGTTVCFTLPMSVAGDVRTSHDEASLPDTPPLRVLLAEDDQVSVFAARRLLERLGHVVVCAENGRQALEALRGGEFDVVLMDVQMPVMDGLQATRLIRADAGLGPMAGVPIIAMTAYAMSGDRDICLAAGMDGYISKPVGARELVRALACAVHPGGQCTIRDEGASC